MSGHAASGGQGEMQPALAGPAGTTAATHGIPFGGYVEPGDAGWAALVEARGRLALALEAEALGLLFEPGADVEPAGGWPA
jgi:hypothetical protein